MLTIDRDRHLSLLHWPAAATSINGMNSLERVLLSAYLLCAGCQDLVVSNSGALSLLVNERDLTLRLSQPGSPPLLASAPFIPCHLLNLRYALPPHFSCTIGPSAALIWISNMIYIFDARARSWRAVWSDRPLLSACFVQGCLLIQKLFQGPQSDLPQI